MREQTKEPKFTMTEKMSNLVIEIAEQVGRVSMHSELSSDLNLRRENRIKSIYSSLAIEQNTLSLEQVSDVIGGKRVLGPPEDIKEAKNAYEAYELLLELNPYSVEDLLRAHGIMMRNLVEEAGRYRSRNVGVFSGDEVIHLGALPRYVPSLIDELFVWLKESNLHPLIKSCVFHYEFEFVHPFSDGNGRMGRLWHTLILTSWQSFFAWLPIETLIHRRQREYYEALNQSNVQGESTIFVEFMLGVIRDTLFELLPKDRKEKVNSVEEQILFLLSKDSSLTARKIAQKLDMSERQIQRILRAMKDKGIIIRVGSNRSGKWIIN